MPVTISGDGGISGLGGLDGYDLQTQTLVVSGDTTLAPQAVGRASLFVDESTNTVGINTTTPNSSVFLEVADGTDPIVSLNNTGNGALQLGCNSSRGYIGTSTAHDFRLRSNGSDRVSILANGDVGINTVSPAAKFEVQTGNGERIQFDTIGGSQTPMISLVRDSGVDYNFINNQGIFTIRRNNSDEIYRYSSDSHTLSCVALGVIARFQSTGNFGVGAHTPAYPLDITNRDTTGGYAFRLRTNATAGKGGIQFTSDASPASLRANVFGNDDGSLSVGTGGSGLERLRIDSTGRVLIGALDSVPSSTSVNSTLQVHSTSGPAIFGRFANDSTASALYLIKSRSSTIGIQTIVNNNDNIGRIAFEASDGTQLRRAAIVDAFVDGTPSTADMPGRLVFSTTADGNNSPSERMRIRNDGTVAIGTTVSTADSLLRLGGTTGNAADWRGLYAYVTFNSNVTNNAIGIQSRLATATDSFNINTLTHFYALRSTIGAGSTITNQIGFYATNSITGATNNYGFRSDINVAAGRWNFYAAGSASNYFAGNVHFNYTGNNLPGSGNTEVGGVFERVSDGATLFISRTNNIAGRFNRNSNGDVHDFRRSGNSVGTISVTTSATSYNTSSDYRLKENVVGLTNASDRIKALKPCRFNFIAEPDKTVDGFLAHEAQEVVPEAVTGEKDGEKMQSIDTSKLVPLLTAALQESIARIDELQKEVNALKSNQVN